MGSLPWASAAPPSIDVASSAAAMLRALSIMIAVSSDFWLIE
jgi:hypothetical protein